MSRNVGVRAQLSPLHQPDGAYANERPTSRRRRRSHGLRNWGSPGAAALALRPDAAERQRPWQHESVRVGAHPESSSERIGERQGRRRSRAGQRRCWRLRIDECATARRHQRRPTPGRPDALTLHFSENGRSRTGRFFAAGLQLLLHVLDTRKNDAFGALSCVAKIEFILGQKYRVAVDVVRNAGAVGRDEGIELLAVVG